MILHKIVDKTQTLLPYMRRRIPGNPIPRTGTRQSVQKVQSLFGNALDPMCSTRAVCTKKTAILDGKHCSAGSRQQRAAPPATVQAWLIPLGKRHFGPKQQRKKGRNLGSQIRSLQGFTQQGIGRGHAIGREHQRFKEPEAITDHAQFFQVGFHFGKPIDQRPFLQAIVFPAPVKGDAKMDVGKRIKTPTKPSAATAPPKGKAGQQTMGRRKKADPTVRFAKRAYAQHQRVFGKLHTFIRNYRISKVLTSPMAASRG